MEPTEDTVLQRKWLFRTIKEVTLFISNRSLRILQKTINPIKRNN